MTTLRDTLTDAIRYWETRRILYNAALAAIVATVWAIGWPASRAAISADTIQHVFLLAVLANIAYCAAYVVDLPAQWSAFAERWRRHRWILLCIGIAFAGIVTRFIATAIALRAG